MKRNKIGFLGQNIQCIEAHNEARYDGKKKGVKARCRHSAISCWDVNRRLALGIQFNLGAALTIPHGPTFAYPTAAMLFGAATRNTQAPLTSFYCLSVGSCYFVFENLSQTRYDFPNNWATLILLHLAKFFHKESTFFFKGHVSLLACGLSLSAVGRIPFASRRSPEGRERFQRPGDAVSVSFRRMAPHICTGVGSWQTRSMCFVKSNKNQRFN